MSEPPRPQSKYTQQTKRTQRPALSIPFAQVRQALHNVTEAVTAAGAKLTDVVRWNVAVVDGQPLGAAFAAFQEAWGEAGDPPAISVQIVAGLANPRFLVEIDAIAAV